MLQQKLSASIAPMTSPSTTDDSSRSRPLVGSVKTFEGKDGENSLLWVREVEMTLASAMLQNEQKRVALAISKLGDRAREWAFTCGASVEAAFPSLKELMRQLLRVFSPTNQAYRVRLRFLAARQGKKELVDFVQELETLIAGMAADPLPEAVAVNIFMKGLRAGVARMAGFRVHSSSSEVVMNLALNAKLNFRPLQLGWNAHRQGSSSGPEPMRLSYAAR
ncbi:Retrotransposon gag domain [Plasmopara halstedii]|uniref:Retrotransposon gag domain n=1 Tax=Plasmopara halstedii TaxID=4781 RepID=A0A0P1B4P1_PLAHL|nr:Retrotransposon gag domain [Plasmopara halstedii]CEG48408.1 Retrotransposon gag domain [Plasmopara halstedii]|eukprot:XP_024584777.1 Retrotransposon gag domain [Plasmopara halstedii]